MGTDCKSALSGLWTVRQGKLDEILDAFYKVSSFASKYALKLKTKIDEAFFWSGRTEGIGGQHISLDIAISKNGTTLENLIEKNKIPMPEWDSSNINTVKIWEEISKTYANQVSGEIRAVIGKSLRKGNIWENKELPALKNNLNVTKITTIDPKTKQEKIIFKR
ncbi:hypothetical protein J2X31_003203 [Flavobacterium arsenatis]|uniref:Uncharacterized protein n=1 Tax=Flavobacterium arsenatis TaxID=1484332 RepID=A0ABU1TTG7_9FLAO|nr:hypothetical protein [Flavobacterium arsenatis]MDR6969176.1 hypothetical protein [Flavobacterium arsenatis]